MRRGASPSLLFSVLCLVAFNEVRGWTAPVKTSTRLQRTVCRASTTDQSVLGGVAEFEEWFSSEPGASCLPAIQHATFGPCLRGLTYTVGDSLEKSTQALTVPDSLVLQAPFSDENWDVQLAQQLWDECLKGTSSKIHGYCALLTLGTPVTADSCPPSTAPNALRRWTEAQKERLQSSERGMKLLNAQKEQELQWKNKFASVKNMNWEQFQWAMEVVHSRAFCGNFGGSTGGVLSAAAPVVAAGAGIAYLNDNQAPSDAVLFGLAILGALPTLVSFASPDKGNAVLLPLIDSANHLEAADSSIEYNPLAKAFTLNIGPKCLVQEAEGETQLYISYGSKSDAELLLNYGFLPGISCSDGNDDTARDSQRKRLAEAFCR